MESELVSSGAAPVARRPRLDSNVPSELVSSGAAPVARRPRLDSNVNVLVAGPGASKLAAILARRGSFRVSGAPPGVSLSEQIAAAAPDVLVLDAGPGRAAGIARRLARDLRLPPTVVLSDDPAAALRADAVSAGIRAILPREATPAEMIAAIEAVAAGLVVAHPSALGARRALAAARRAPDRAAAQPLTRREIDVLGMIAEGFGNRSIATRLGISLHTVKFHIAAILDKLDASSRTEAVTTGLRQGVIMI